jgi:hypothetical protein
LSFLIGEGERLSSIILYLCRERPNRTLMNFNLHPTGPVKKMTAAASPYGEGGTYS